MVKRSVKREVITKMVSGHFTKSGKRISPNSEFSEQLEILDFDGPYGSVSVKYGLTIDLGNYESARCDVLITVPCYTEELDRALMFASSKAEKAIQSEVAKIKGPRK